jgi:hypothetical protein
MDATWGCPEGEGSPDFEQPEIANPPMIMAKNILFI